MGPEDIHSMHLVLALNRATCLPTMCQVPPQILAEIRRTCLHISSLFLRPARPAQAFHMGRRARCTPTKLAMTEARFTACTICQTAPLARGRMDRTLHLFHRYFRRTTRRALEEHQLTITTAFPAQIKGASPCRQREELLLPFLRTTPPCLVSLRQESKRRLTCSEAQT